MSVVAPSQRRFVWPVAIALTGSMIVALLMYLPTRTPTVEPSKAGGSVAAPGVTQPAWKMRTFPAGGAGVKALSTADKARLDAQRKPVAALIKDLYDALFLQPGHIRSALRAHLTTAAAKQAAAAKIGVPPTATDVHIQRRSARVGIHMQGASRAAARVVVAGKAQLKGRKLRFHHAATLWLERARRTWKVIAFDVTQGPRG